jgi:hypothetical protein
MSMEKVDRDAALSKWILSVRKLSLTVAMSTVTGECVPTLGMSTFAWICHRAPGRAPGLF